MTIPRLLFICMFNQIMTFVRLLALICILSTLPIAWLIANFFFYIDLWICPPDLFALWTLNLHVTLCMIHGKINTFISAHSVSSLTCQIKQETVNKIIIKDLLQNPRWFKFWKLVTESQPVFCPPLKYSVVFTSGTLGLWLNPRSKRRNDWSTINLWNHAFLYED